MAFSLIVNVAAGSTVNNTVTTGAVDTTGADFLVAIVSDVGVGDIPAVSDSKSNSWTALTRKVIGFAGSKIHYCQSPTVGSGHTFTASSAGASSPSIAVLAFSGSAVSPFDVENGATGQSVSSLSTGSVTPSENNELVIAGVCWYPAGTVSINGGFTISDQVNYDGVHMGVGAAYLIQTSAAAANPAWSGVSFSDVAATIATFKAPGAAETITVDKWYNQGPMTPPRKKRVIAY